MIIIKQGIRNEQESNNKEIVLLFLFSVDSEYLKNCEFAISRQINREAIRILSRVTHRVCFPAE